jgi:DNA polymerase-3 subunit alpha (Gram-positive type)
MERAGTGKYSSRGMPENVESLLHSLDLPDWYPDYLKKVRYLFPKGHSVAYIMVDMVYQWLRLHDPCEFEERTEKSSE